MPVSVLRADRSHLDALAGLFDGYRQFYRQPSDPEGARRFLAERFEYEDSVVYVAADGERLVGFTQLYPFWSSVRMRRVWVLNDLFVDEGARGQGVARALMEAARAFAASTGAASLELATERDNAPAQALYDSLGYARDEAYWHYVLTL